MSATSLISLSLLLPALAWAGIAPPQDALVPAGPQAARIHDLWQIMLWVCTLVFAAILACLVYVLWRRPRSQAGDAPDLALAASPERRTARHVGAAVLASVLLLLFLIVASMLTDRALARLSLKDAVHIEVTANQWWWDVRYDDGQPDHVFNTANELHIPVGRPVIVTLKSGDVIHSLWVPNLHGKKDLIPGRTSTLHLQADNAGVYRGQCAEFCGLQHTFMALTVTAEQPDLYEAWIARQRQSAAEPKDKRLLHGRDLFLSGTCVMCHAVQGTTANARRGPDLTHLAARPTLAAGTLPNNADNLARWIRDPQQFKPGTNMPASNLSDDDIQAIVAYLQSLS